MKGRAVRKQRAQAVRKAGVKYYGVFDELPIIAVEPRDWLQAYLQQQKQGLTGRLPDIGYPFDTGFWGRSRERGGLGDEIKKANWWPYEQTGYWIDGAIRCGILLKDPALIQRAGKFLEAVLRAPDRDGYLGPAFLKSDAAFYRWPHAVLFRALAAYQALAGGPQIPEALRRHYLSGAKTHHQKRLSVVNLEAMLWAFRQTGDRRLLALARKDFAGFNRVDHDRDTALHKMLDRQPLRQHGVIFNETAQLAAVLYLSTGQKHLLKAAQAGYQKITDHHMLIDGVHSSSENFRGADPLDSHEVCNIVAYPWSLGYLLLATGDVKYADAIERATLNAGPGAVTADFSATQYFSCPNQVVATDTSNHNRWRTGNQRMAYRPIHEPECCSANINRLFPNYLSRMWLATGAGGIAAALYGPSRITFTPGKMAMPVTIIEETNYPFNEQIDFTIQSSQPVRFPFSFRIPGWCQRPEVRLNGVLIKRRWRTGTFATIRRTWKNQDRLSVVLPMEITLTSWAGGGIGIERGPLVYALKIQERWKISRAANTKNLVTKKFPAYNLYPASPWNYALAATGKKLLKSLRLIRHPITNNPWTIHSAPLELQVPAYKVKGWKLIQSNTCIRIEPDGKLQKGKFVFTPPLPERPTLAKRLAARQEIIRLVPYGCTKLRLSVFPHK